MSNNIVDPVIHLHTLKPIHINLSAGEAITHTDYPAKEKSEANT
jgi:hypothetical protein